MFAALTTMSALPTTASGAWGQDPEKSDEQESKIRESVVKISATLRYPGDDSSVDKAQPAGRQRHGGHHRRQANSDQCARRALRQPALRRELSVERQAARESRGGQLLESTWRCFGSKTSRSSTSGARCVRTESLPEVKDTVLVYGYPQGGSTQSVTKGIVSRIEFAVYGEGTSGVRVQVDAAINPGNSGGPAIVDGKMVGLIFSKLGQADNIGYIIPSEEIDLFLKDVGDGHYDGKPAMHESLQTLENDALRTFLKLDKKTQGMVVHSTDRSEPNDPLKPFDVLTKIADHEIDNVGMVKIKDNLRLQVPVFDPEGRQGRQGADDRGARRQDDSARCAGEDRSIRCSSSSLKGRYPSYFIYGPLVFSPVSNEFVSALDRQVVYGLALIDSPLAMRRGDLPKFEGEELVVVSSPMFPHRIGKGYDNPFYENRQGSERDPDQEPPALRRSLA